jgi:hypothetical protein
LPVVVVLLAGGISFQSVTFFALTIQSIRGVSVATSRALNHFSFLFRFYHSCFLQVMWSSIAKGLGVQTDRGDYIVQKSGGQEEGKRAY